MEGDIFSGFLSNLVLLRHFGRQWAECTATGFEHTRVPRRGIALGTNLIGIRMAIDASRADIVQIILREALLVVGVEVGIGLAGSLALSHSIRSLLFEVGPGDPITLSAVSILLAGIALFACFIPARRATQIDPMTALRCD